MSRCLGLFACLALAVSVPAQQPAGSPGLSPDFMYVAEFDDAKGQLRLRLIQYREQEVQQLAVDKGVTLTIEKGYGPFHMDRFLKLKECKVMEASGKVIPAADAAKRLTVGAPVVVATDGKAPSQAFLQLLRPETLVLVGPQVKLDPRIPFSPFDDKKMPGGALP